MKIHKCAKCGRKFDETNEVFDVIRGRILCEDCTKFVRRIDSLWVSTQIVSGMLMESDTRAAPRMPI